ncbi:SDR family oxidoreductase [Longimicrobium terrae]|uniref:Pteridine reductase n=1 Tax=Longimicrobium terrae TaxID=1639882 RepID=A0A841GWA9_9BACT|nr:SDR family oxidoreductase [Longimicrobium terrae]MBB4635499.1 pteridine reductase [Longimicrobium terrae]MBB6069893.1 pteridine reductase [Longimicrobium terrae]NNC32807.1 SDR family oxidoreductase [Longimicrobium terrae]
MSRTALVTGGAVRIGRAITEALAGAGYRVVIHYNSSSGPAEELRDAITAKGGEARIIGADLSRTDEVKRLADEAAAAFGGIDVLINSASVFPAEKLEETDEALWEQTMGVNLRAPFFLIRHLAHTLRERKGAVINMADLAGLQPWASYAAHSISKAGVVQMTKVAARSLAPEVRVNAIAPGAVLPPDDMSQEEVDRLARTAPLQRNGSPADVVRAVLYLLEADFVTGETLVVDGGRLLRT